MRKLIIAAAASLLLAGCGYLGKTSAVIADGASSYCAAATPAARAAVRLELQDELVAEDIAVCLACPGDAAAACVGADRAPTTTP